MTIIKTQIERRKEILNAMQTLMEHLNDEYDYENWLFLGEIENEEMARSIAEDDELFDDYVKTFRNIVKDCIKDSKDLY